MPFWRNHRAIGPSAAAEPALLTLTGPTMGTRYNVKLVGPTGAAFSQVAAALQDAVDGVDAQMSTWQPQSALSQFNASAVGAWFPVPADLAKVVALGLEISALSDGAFDMCVGSAVNRWGFGPDSAVPLAGVEGSLPRFQILDVQRDPPALRKAAPVYLDLSGIAKGFGVDAMVAVLHRHGVENYIVEIDGELRTNGKRPDGTPWRVGVSEPDAALGAVRHMLALQSTAMATSGDYRRYFDMDGQRFSHTIDPRTGRPTTSSVASVTVADASCARADALATALLVLGAERGPALAERLKIDALFLIRTGDSIVEKLTWRFDRFLQS